MPEIRPIETPGGRNMCAFLDMIAWSEGTDHPSQKSKDRGYDVLVGGTLFESYEDHPRKIVHLPRLGINSSAAGRYQLLARYWNVYSRQLKLPDFSPLSQDLVAIQQIKERRAVELIEQGKIVEAIGRVKNIWASLPGAGYGQHEHKTNDLLMAYENSGGRYG